MAQQRYGMAVLPASALAPRRQRGDKPSAGGDAAGESDISVARTAKYGMARKMALSGEMKRRKKPAANYQ
jgi:hypothetical protein